MPAKQLSVRMENDGGLALLSSRLAAARKHAVSLVQLKTSDLAAKNRGSKTDV